MRKKNVTAAEKKPTERSSEKETPGSGDFHPQEVIVAKKMSKNDQTVQGGKI